MEEENHDPKNGSQTKFFVSFISFMTPVVMWSVNAPYNMYNISVIENSGNNPLHWTLISIVFLHLLLGWFSRKFIGEVWRSYLIGVIMIVGLTLCSAKYKCQEFGWYLCVVAFFHISEYLVTARYNPSSLSYDTFLLNHSTAYTLAHLACSFEYGITLYFFPVLKSLFYMRCLGLILCIMGEIIRKGAMRTAGVAFTHQIQYDKRDSHKLITHGFYSYCRHPSYAGWFLWSVATQLILCNPISFVGFMLASWQFFDSRIRHEEMVLLNFFEMEYVRYQRAVPFTGVPYVEGYIID